jgi:large subunit ribosomal protein L21
MYAVIQDRSRQFTVRKGDVILCDFDAPKAEGEKITFDQVLMVSGEGVSKIGKPTVAGASVTAEVLGMERGEKLIVFRFRRRKNIRKKRGHRQLYTKVRIQEVNA